MNPDVLDLKWRTNRTHATGVSRSRVNVAGRGIGGSREEGREKNGARCRRARGGRRDGKSRLHIYAYIYAGERGRVRGTAEEENSGKSERKRGEGEGE